MNVPKSARRYVDYHQVFGVTISLHMILQLR